MIPGGQRAAGLISRLETHGLRFDGMRPRVSAGEFLLRSRRVVRPETTGPATVWIRGGRIAGIAAEGEAVPGPPGLPVTDVGARAVLPGLVDTHVHVNEPGRADWEGFVTATRAAAAGGVTTLIDMPLNSIPPTTTKHAFAAKLEAAAGKCRVNVGFWGGVVPGNREELAPLFSAGVFGFKCFLVDSGVPEFAKIGGEVLSEALDELARIGALLVVHVESPDSIREISGGEPRSYARYLASRPRAAENDAVERMIRLSRHHRARVHILHLSSGEAVEAIGRARAEGVAVSAETCPHYLLFASDEIPEGATEFKCAPPIRERENRERLWQALSDGVISMVVSDHSPSPPELKRRGAGDFAGAWGGISSLELGLAAVWTAASERGFPLARLAEWMCGAPARLAGLDGRKGSIETGRDADLVVFDPEAVWTVDPEKLHHRHKLTPYAGRTLKGAVEATYLKGEKIYERGEFLSEPRGEIVLYG